MYRRLDGSHIVGDPARARAAVGREGRRVLIVSDRRIVLLLDVFDQAFDHRAWHGTPLWGALRGVSHREALWRPRGRGHNTWGSGVSPGARENTQRGAPTRAR